MKEIERIISEALALSADFEGVMKDNSENMCEQSEHLTKYLTYRFCFQALQTGDIEVKVNPERTHLMKLLKAEEYHE